jgi:hypothetical protein
VVLDIYQDSDKNDGRNKKGQHRRAASMNEQAVGSVVSARVCKNQRPLTRTAIVWFLFEVD